MADSRLLDSYSAIEIDGNFHRLLALLDTVIAAQEVDAANITALYALAKCAVTFDSAGGSAVSSQLVPYGGTATEPTLPTFEGHTFTGWLLDEIAYDFAAELTSNITLTASWSNDNVSENG